jgi:hypothetical protein
MTIYMKIFSFILLSLLLVPFTAWAAKGDLPVRTSGIYLGAGVGYSEVSLNKSSVNISGGDVSYRFTAGYRFPQKFLPWGMSLAIEGDYLDLGEVSDQSAGTEFNLEISGFDFYGVGYLPMTRSWDFFGKLGVYAWDGKLSANGVPQPENGATDWAAGLGFAWRTGKATAVEFELEHFNLLDGAWLASASWIYQFK